MRKLLGVNPYLGPVEQYLAELPTTYRSVVVFTMNKMVYRIVDNRIEVDALWDCRREPDWQAAQTIARSEENKP